MRTASRENCPCTKCHHLEKLEPEIEGFRIINKNGIEDHIFYCKRLHKKLEPIDSEVGSEGYIPDVSLCNYRNK